MLDELILAALQNDTALAEMLASYDGCPAVFKQSAPPDNDDGWDGGSYPRVVFTVDLRPDPERKTAGSVLLDIHCADSDAARPEDIAREALRVISDAFFTDENADSFYVLWNRTDLFPPENQNTGAEEALVYGATITCELLEFPAQATFSPDPVAALCEFANESGDGYTIISGAAQPQGVYRPTDDEPALYCRVVSLSTDARQKRSDTWFRAVYALHLMCPGAERRNIFARRLAGMLQAKTVLILDDGSPFLVESTDCNPAGDPLRAGQITVSGRFAALDPLPNITSLDHIYTNLEDLHG
ncbi:MAG: hypothetical protein LBQ91_06245 [Oscillospiraceae bacterium]|jgi:hypothetical protein|nr:hypothetical protein [Oscillospiraceae bacterium]